MTCNPDNSILNLNKKFPVEIQGDFIQILNYFLLRV